MTNMTTTKVKVVSRVKTNTMALKTHRWCCTSYNKVTQFRMAPKTWLDWTCSASQRPHCHDVLFSRADYRGRGRQWRYWTLVADLAGDVTTSPVRTAHCHWIQQLKLIVDQTSWWLWLFQVPQLYQAIQWYQKQLSKCPQPSRVIKGWNEEQNDWRCS